MVERLKEVLKEEYGICSQEELEAAMKDNEGIDIGIFTKELNINAMEVAS